MKRLYKESYCTNKDQSAKITILLRALNLLQNTSPDTVFQLIQTLYTGKGNQAQVQLQFEFCEKVDSASALAEMSQDDNHNLCIHPKTRL